MNATEQEELISEWSELAKRARQGVDVRSWLANVARCDFSVLNPWRMGELLSAPSSLVERTATFVGWPNDRTEAEAFLNRVLAARNERAKRTIIAREKGRAQRAKERAAYDREKLRVFKRGLKLLTRSHYTGLAKRNDARQKKAAAALLRLIEREIARTQKRLARKP